ncbi:MAG: hypothetical protein M3N93_03865 [Acidobacteriota bacterium]|nr:hypothetical protein [Acidobacteriota bacterium]
MTNSKLEQGFCSPARALVLAICAFLLPQVSVAQKSAAPASSDKDTRPYDKHDFTGIWARNPAAQFGQPPCPECRNVGPVPGYPVTYGYFGDVPPRTPEGEKKFRMNRPTKGYVIGSKEALAHMDIEEGFRRAVESKMSNDPEERCEPLGLIRLVTFSGGNAPMQIIQTNEILVQKFEWFWENREIWLDGRALPKKDDYLPRFNGYSVGKWEGDTLVVSTVGFDDRQWIDGFGYPISGKAVLEERYSRPSRNRLRLDMTLTDPTYYTRPWHSSTKIWALIPKKAAEISGWSGLGEDHCVPSDNDYFRTFEPDVPGAKNHK